MERINFQSFNDVEVIEQYQIEIWERVASFGNVDDKEVISRAWEKIIENI
jgi:hypothetical protein